MLGTFIVIAVLLAWAVAAVVVMAMCTLAARADRAVPAEPITAEALFPPAAPAPLG